MKSKSILRRLPVATLAIGISATLSVIVVGCSSAPAEIDPSADPAQPVDVSLAPPSDAPAELSVPDEFFGAVEAIALEFEARQADGSLGNEWLEIWSTASAARQSPGVSELIGAIRQSENATQLLARDGEAIDGYIAAFVPVAVELDRRELDGSLDASLLALYSPLKALVAGFAESDTANTHSDTFCCKIYTVQSLLPLITTVNECNEYHTLGVWARIKCGAVLAAFPFAASSLSRHSCSSDSECNPATQTTVTAQSTYPGYSAQGAADGNTDTRVGGGWANGHTYTPDGRVPQWLQFDFHALRTINGVRLFTSAGYEIQDYEIQSLTSWGWQTEVSVTGNVDVQRESLFASPVTTSMIRLVAKRGHANEPWYVRVNELEFF
jgi:F5/8 type C domain